MDVPVPPLNALSVDVEDYYHVSAFAHRVNPGDWPRFTPRVVHNTLRLLALFERHGVRATFFVLGWVAERNKSLVREIAAVGHEIGCHGYSHALIYRQTPEQFREETRRAKAIIEEAAGVPVSGYRAASYSIVERTRWALDILCDEGFVYDSSIFPVHHDRYGIPDAPLAPHVLTTPSGAPLVEFPPTAVEVAGLRVPAGGGGYFRLYPYALSSHLLRRANGEGRPFMFYLHPWEIDPEQPRLRAGVLARFRHYVNLHRCEPRLNSLLNEFRFAPTREVLRDMGMLPFRHGDREAAYA